MSSSGRPPRPLTLVILAAGAGTRYGGVKQLAPVGPGGETLLEYSAFDALRAGFGRVVLVIRAPAEQAFRDRLDAGMGRHVAVEYVHQSLDGLPDGLRPPTRREKPWGTGQAVLAAGELIDGPFAVVNGDDFYGAESYRVLSGFLAGSGSGRRLAAVGFKVAETLADGGPVARALLERDDEGRLGKIVEIFEVWRQGGRVLYHDRQGRRQALRGDELVSMNMWGFTPRLLPELRRGFRDFLDRSAGAPDSEFLLPEVIHSMVRQGRFRVEILPGSGVRCGITFPGDRERVGAAISSLVARGRYPEDLWS